MILSRIDSLKYSINIKSENKKLIADMCIAHLGPQLYYISTEFGGRKWRIVSAPGGRNLRLETDDESFLTWISLSV